MDIGLYLSLAMDGDARGDEITQPPRIDWQYRRCEIGMIAEPLRQSLTDRRCEECDLYLYIEDRTPGGAITHYCCALGHHLFVDMWGAQIREVEP